MNPKGQVPVLKHGEQVVVDSDKILVYIDNEIGTPGSMSQVPHPFGSVDSMQPRHGCCLDFLRDVFCMCAANPFQFECASLICRAAGLPWISGGR